MTGSTWIMWAGADGRVSTFGLASTVWALAVQKDNRKNASVRHTQWKHESKFIGGRSYFLKIILISIHAITSYGTSSNIFHQPTFATGPAFAPAPTFAAAHTPAQASAGEAP